MAARPHGSTRNSDGWSVGPNEPLWRINGGFSPPVSSRWEHKYGELSSSSRRSQLHRTSFSSSRSASRVGSGRFNHYQRDASDGLVSNLNSPSESFRAPQWTPLAQGVNVGEFAASASESLPRTSTLTPSNEAHGQTGFSTVLDTSDSSSCRFSMDIGPMTVNSHGASLKRNLSGSYSSLSKLAPRYLFRRQNSDSRTCLKNAIGGSQRALLDGGQCSQGAAGQPAGGPDLCMQSFSQLMASSRREGFRWSDASCLPEVNWNINEIFLDQELPLHMDTIKKAPCEDIASHLSSANCEGDMQKCGLCSRWLMHRSPWSSHRMLGNNDYPVVGVLVCGHVYHAECLEKAVPDSLKHDPPCPQCEKIEITNSKAPIQDGLDGVKGTSEAFKSKLSRFTSQFQRNVKSSPLVEADGRKGAGGPPVPTGEKRIFPRSLSKRQFSFRGKSSKDSSAQSSGSKKSSSPAQVSPENQLFIHQQ